MSKYVINSVLTHTEPVEFPRIVGVVTSDGIQSVSDGHAVTERRGRVGASGAGRLVLLMMTVRRDRRRLRPHRFDRQHPPSLLGQFGSRLRVRVEQREVGHDHRNRKRYGQDTGQRAQRTDEHADVRLRRHITVPDRRHRHYGPPQSDRDGCEVVGRVVLDALGVVDKRRENDDADN